MQMQSKIAKLSIDMFNRENKLAQNTLLYLEKYLSKNDSILDVGTGNGLVAKLIREKIGARVTGIDVIDINHAPDKTIIFNGHEIPFGDNSFSVSICPFVLHHAANQEKLLEETRRVTQSAIIILEDIPQTFYDKILGFLHKFSSIIRYKK
jgi:ubiquinone/menaquinone biosynthesis C-methylase UbiE